MRTLFGLFALLLGASATAQGIIPRMHAAAGEPDIIIASATNAFQVPFVEVNREIPNAEFVLRLGIPEEEVPRFVLITPSTIHLVERSGDEVNYSTPEWGDRVFTSAASRFNKLALTGEGEGATLKPSPYVPGPNYRARGGVPPSSDTYSCTLTSTESSSTMTCRTNGRITSTDTCRFTGSGSTRTMTCNSRTY